MALVTGGASCGKSTLAEALCMGLEGSRIYLAAMRPFGREGEERVKRHRAQRAGKGFTTIECYEDFGKIADDPRIEGATVLLECLGNVVANDLFDEDDPSGVARIADAVRAIGDRAGHLVVVNNEVGSDGVRYAVETHEYQRVLGEVAQRVAQRCDIAVECVGGCPIVLAAPGIDAIPESALRVLGLAEGGAR